MTGLVHRYFRRVVRWASTPSNEDIFLQDVAALNAEAERQKRNIRNLLLGKSMGLTKAMVGLSKQDVKDTIMRVFEVWRDMGEISDERAAYACDQICQVNRLSLAELVRSGDVQWPLNCSYESEAYRVAS